MCLISVFSVCVNLHLASQIHDRYLQLAMTYDVLASCINLSVALFICALFLE